jgi:hypothetical protein
MLGDLFGTPQGSPRTEKLIAARVQWTERIMEKIDERFSRRENGWRFSEHLGGEIVFEGKTVCVLGGVGVGPFDGTVFRCEEANQFVPTAEAHLKGMPSPEPWDVNVQLAAAI